MDSVKRLVGFNIRPFKLLQSTKGQTNSKWFFKAKVSLNERTDKFDFTTCWLVFVRFLEESEDTKKKSWNYLTFNLGSD